MRISTVPTNLSCRTNIWEKTWRIYKPLSIRWAYAWIASRTWTQKAFTILIRKNTKVLTAKKRVKPRAARRAAGKLPVITPTIKLDFDSLYQAQAPSSKAALFRPSQVSIENIKNRLLFRAPRLATRPIRYAATWRNGIRNSRYRSLASCSSLSERP